MIFIIISNIGLALMTILMYMRYSHFRVSYGNKIKELSRDLRAEKDQKKLIEEGLTTDYRKENDQVKSLLRELEQSRKERQDEIKMRLTAEKEIAVSREKISQVQKRIEDWKLLQEGAINDSKNVIMKFGQDLAKKIKVTQEEGDSKTRNLFEENVKSLENNVNTLHQEIGGIDSRIVDFRKKISNDINKQRAGGGGFTSSKASTPENNGAEDILIEDETPISKPKNVEMDEIAKKSMNDVLSLIKASGFTHMKDYIVASQLDEKKAKYMLCDLFLLVEGVAYFIDFKADKFFVDYAKFSSGPEGAKALESLKGKLDKYIAYVSNPKYSALIKKLIAALKIEASDFKIVFAVRNYEDDNLLAKIGYSKKVSDSGLELMDVNAINDLIL